jgi:DNA topoisomerase I
MRARALFGPAISAACPLPGCAFLQAGLDPRAFRRHDLKGTVMSLSSASLAAVADPLPPAVDPPLDPVATARAAGLRYVNDDTPGIRRRRSGKGWTYLSPKGEVITGIEERARIASLAIPPAWTEVWICPLANGHIQATGRDARGRKQYRYHPEWRRARDDNKYGRMIAFAEALPALRERIDADLGLRGMPREKVLAGVVRLLETTLIRVGNDEYARHNESYGLTTLRSDHVEVDGAKVTFSFRGKSGVEHSIDIRDRRLATIVRRCQDLPGEELFEYVDEGGVNRDVTSGDVNDYLREISGQDFTAKDFRTWGGTVLALFALLRMGAGGNVTESKKNVVEAVKQVAKALGNRPATCRKFYIHPAVLDAYSEGTLAEAAERALTAAGVETGEAGDLRCLEIQTLALLRERAASAAPEPPKKRRRKTAKA